ncbi:DUF4124 domain-containing protein [Lysobacter sp. A6]|uniref:DUF4124 domain-containing protein n=1 Tax=Noviluteimonas lactosilytica TaxID=2888523 RepID=A0ABS8JD54_9GAMM|nr:DUF4124 domain-containing protein [Lysobacter lactosilyticus]MCC8361472.1 DUF4124 domain-containing protein [Lysobacter lactosilyticus]
MRGPGNLDPGGDGASGTLLRCPWEQRRLHPGRRRRRLRMEARFLSGRGGKEAFMQRVAWILGLFAATPSGLGAELFRCIDPAGGVTWQDAPCGAGSRLTKTLEVPEAASDSDVPSGAPAKAKDAKSKGRVASGSSVGSSSGRPGGAKRDGRSRQRETCKAARAERDRKLEALGLTRTFEQLRALDDKVRAKCKDL